MKTGKRVASELDVLETRLTGPKRIALFGHRNVGKTTLLAMFYREASSGRVPGLRIAAADAHTAEYLAEKIAQIEYGQPMAGSLAETGSTLLFPLFNLWAPGYAKQYPQVKISTAGTGSGKGISGAAAGTTPSGSST